MTVGKIPESLFKRTSPPPVNLALGDFIFKRGRFLLNQVIGMIYMMGRLVREMLRRREDFVAV